MKQLLKQQMFLKNLNQVTSKKSAFSKVVVLLSWIKMASSVYIFGGFFENTKNKRLLVDLKSVFLKGLL